MSPSSEKRFRLRGDVGGIEHLSIVNSGETRIGSVATGNDVVLPVRGVSKHHALLRYDDGGLFIQDLESRNGVRVNGARTLSARLRAGDEVGLGPVVLQVELVDAGDASIVIQGDEHVRQPSLLEEETTQSWIVAGQGVPTAWLRIIDGFVERLSAVPEGPVAGALALVVQELGARRCCLVEWSGKELVVVAAAGAVDEPLSFAPPSSKAPFQSTRLDDGRTITWAVASPPAAPCGIAVSGDYVGRAESAPLLRTLLNLWRRLRREPEQLVHEDGNVNVRSLVFPEGYVSGASPAMTSLFAQMKPLVQGDLPVLIEGETGAGKELIARILHASSARAKGPFVAVNCAAVPAELLEAEMFGIGKGVATGVTERPGRFRLAHGGTLFLDEIGDMSLDLQAKLLRAVQEKEIQPVGEKAPVPVDIRFLAATNTDLLGRMEAGRFRRDLYFRLSGYVLRIPALRHRREDVPALVESFLRLFSREISKRIQGMTPNALQALIDYSWPGNVRELEHEVRRLVYLCAAGGVIDSSLVSPHMLAAPALDVAGSASPSSGLDLDEHVKRLEERLIRQALASTGNNVTRAAKLLGISRNGLADKMQRLSLSDPRKLS